MASFTDLPPELQEAIILETPPRDLNNLSKTCKSIRAVALPALLRRVEFTWDSRVSYSPPITPLLRSLLENPHLGTFIKELELKALHYRGFNAPGFNGDILLPAHTHRIPASDWQLFENALEACPCEEKGVCADPTTREGNLNAGIAVLISRCTRVKTLRIDVELLMHNYRLSAMLRSTLYRTLGPWGKPSWFEKLAHVVVTCSSSSSSSGGGREHHKQYATRLPVPGETFLKLFYLPAIKTLHLTFFPNITSPAGAGVQNPTTSPHTPAAWPFPQPPRPSYLTTLRLHRSPALPQTLDFLLATTPALTTLEYDCVLGPPPERSQRQIRTEYCLATLSRALHRVRHTMCHVFLRCAVFPDEDDDDDDDGLASSPPTTTTTTTTPRITNTLSTLAVFPKLRTLDVSLGILYPPDLDAVQDEAEEQEQEQEQTPPLESFFPPTLRRLVLHEGSSSSNTDNANKAGIAALREFLLGRRTGELGVDSGEPPGWRGATLGLKEVVLEGRGWRDMGIEGFMGACVGLDIGVREVRARGESRREEDDGEPGGD